MGRGRGRRRLGRGAAPARRLGRGATADVTLAPHLASARPAAHVDTVFLLFFRIYNVIMYITEFILRLRFVII